MSDRGLEKIGVVKKVQDIIEAAGLKCTSYLDVVPNPTVAVVNEATALYKECGATSIVALGGGSSMDVGKAVGVLVNYGGKITDYEGNHKGPGPIVPMIAIPTTAGTGSEVTASAVITDTERNYKLSVFSYEILPRLPSPLPAVWMPSSTPWRLMFPATPPRFPMPWRKRPWSSLAATCAALWPIARMKRQPVP